jgi:hypothetical protein
MPCGCGGGVRTGTVTSAEVADAGRFVVTRHDGLTQRFASYEEARVYQNTNGGHLDAVPLKART